MAARGRPATVTSLDLVARSQKSSRGPGAETTLDPQTVSDTARYVAHLTAELADMARASRLDLLAYFLDMARIEAGGAVRGEPRA